MRSLALQRVEDTQSFAVRRDGIANQIGYELRPQALPEKLARHHED